jgi:replicative DNA helicase
MNTPKLPFDLEFQKRLLRILIEDDGIAHFLDPHLHAEYFEHEALGWVLQTCQQHKKTYSGYPSIATLHQYLRAVDVRLRSLYEAMLDQVAHADLADRKWLQDATIDFVKRQIFVRTYHETRQLYNAGHVDEAYDVMMRRMDELFRVRWEPVDRGYYFEELPMRHNRRMNAAPWESAITTGLPWLDNIMDGGPTLGQMLIWIGYAKTGKSAMLIHHGAASALSRRRTLHFVFEGSREQVETRYDAHFLDEWYNQVKHGTIDAAKYSQTWQQFQELRGYLIIRGFTDRWDYTVLDIHQELLELERERGWRAEHVVVDYVDLLGGRAGKYNSETEKQRAACRDLKSLANRGYVVTTASQAQRPDKGSEDRAHWIYSSQIADCYDKVRVADMIGSVNATVLERANNLLRLMVELYRDAEAGFKTLVSCEFGKMRIEQRDNLASPSMPDLGAPPAMGYQDQGPRQQKAF